MNEHMPVYIGKETIPALLEYCRRQGFTQFLLVADRNTYRAFGKTVEAALKNQDYAVNLALLEGEEIIAGENALVQVFLQTDRVERIFLAVGSGTITDLTRFTSHRTRTSFLSIPTAPSVDGFTSIGAPLVIGGTKRSYLCHGPAALFADLPTLRAAPGPMIAAGFGDLLGKLTSIADWKLGHLLWDESFDQRIYDRSRQAALNCARHGAEIGRASEEAVRILMEGLIESGFCMLDFGNSNPASGAEHHLSHYWELKMLEEGRPATLHGAKVGVACVISAGWYEALRGLEKSEVARRLAQAQLPDPEETRKSLYSHFGPAAEQIIAEHREFIDMDEAVHARLKERILDRWDEVLEIASAVPSPTRLAEWLRQTGAPVTPREAGLGEGDVQSGLEYSHFLRKRFTINKLRRWLDIPAIG